MNKLAFVGFVLMLAAIPLVQFSLDNYDQYLEQRAEAERQVLECANTICFGGPVLFPQSYFETSMQYLLAGMVSGSIGAIFVGLNWRELVAGSSSGD